MAAILQFPFATTIQADRDPPPVVAQIIPFPTPSDSLSKHDVEVLLGLLESEGKEWVFERERDGNSNLSAVIAHGNPKSRAYAAFLVCRRDGKLRLIDARLAARWGTLGEFHDVENLASALAQLLRR
jgi:hypothetical protein